MSCAWSGTESSRGTQAQTTLSSQSNKKSQIVLEEKQMEMPLRRTIYNPYKDEYVIKMKAKK